MKNLLEVIKFCRQTKLNEYGIHLSEVPKSLYRSTDTYIQTTLNEWR